jgi:iron complex transport system ATP-binding protein
VPDHSARHPFNTTAVVCKAEQIRVVRNSRALLDDVSLELRAGEVLALLGPNGAGKSTLLGALSGELDVASGSVEFLGRPLSEWSLKELARQRAVLLQEHQLMFPFSVYEVVEMGRAPWRRTPEELEDEAAIAQALDLSSVTHLQTRSVPSLSGGERARASFARVLATRSPVLMLDEPTAALDLKHQEAVLEVARDRAQHGDAVLIVVHDLNLATAFADRVALLKDGRLAAQGLPHEVLNAETISDVYETPVEIVQNPRTGHGIVVPVRNPLS